jgi:hypothetical protein
MVILEAIAAIGNVEHMSFAPALLFASTHLVFDITESRKQANSPESMIDNVKIATRKIADPGIEHYQEREDIQHVDMHHSPKHRMPSVTDAQMDGHYEDVLRDIMYRESENEHGVFRSRPVIDRSVIADSRSDDETVCTHQRSH